MLWGPIANYRYVSSHLSYDHFEYPDDDGSIHSSCLRNSIIVFVVSFKIIFDVNFALEEGYNFVD